MDDSLVSSTLEGVDSNVSLGDTNEANASQYIVDTINEGYKLVFIDNAPPLGRNWCTKEDRCNPSPAK